jgi:formate dehydrogenase subunit delta
MKEIDQLVKMANQIAANFKFHEDGVERLADHLRRFWAPVMIRQLSEYYDAGGSGVDEMVAGALQQVRSARPQASL